MDATALKSTRLSRWARTRRPPRRGTLVAIIAATALVSWAAYFLLYPDLLTVLCISLLAIPACIIVERLLGRLTWLAVLPFAIVPLPTLTAIGTIAGIVAYQTGHHRIAYADGVRQVDGNGIHPIYRVPGRFAFDVPRMHDAEYSVWVEDKTFQFAVRNFGPAPGTYDGPFPLPRDVRRLIDQAEWQTISVDAWESGGFSVQDVTIELPAAAWDWSQLGHKQAYAPLDVCLYQSRCLIVKGFLLPRQLQEPWTWVAVIDLETRTALTAYYITETGSVRSTFAGVEYG